MQTPRTGPALLLGSGKVLAIGGYNDADQYRAGNAVNARAELYDPETGNWTSTGDMVTPRGVACSAVVLTSGDVLVVGGSTLPDGFGATATAEIYSAATGTWRPTASLEYAIAFATATLLPSGEVLLIGGCIDGEGHCGGTQRASIYDPGTGTWRETDPTLWIREQAALLSLPSGKVLVVGGTGNPRAGALPVEIFDPATETWSDSERLWYGHGDAAPAVQVQILHNSFEQRRRLIYKFPVESTLKPVLPYADAVQPYGTSPVEEAGRGGDSGRSAFHGSGGKPAEAAEVMSYWADEPTQARGGVASATSAAAAAAATDAAAPVAAPVLLGEAHPNPANLGHLNKTYDRGATDYVQERIEPTSNPEPGEDPSHPPSRVARTEGMRLKGIQSPTGAFADETRDASFRGSPRGAENLHNQNLRPGEEASHITHQFTHYLGPEEQKAATLETRLDPGQPGLEVARLHRANQPADSRGASGIGTHGKWGAGRDIYAMSEGGEFRALDPYANRKLIDDPRKPIADDGVANKQHGFVNHSSLFEGGAVAAAGDMVIDEGRVKNISNASGHYLPGVDMLHQAATALAQRNVMDVATRNPKDRAQIERVRPHENGRPVPNEQMDALRFLAASHGQASIAPEVFGGGFSGTTNTTANRKDELVAEMRAGGDLKKGGWKPRPPSGPTRKWNKDDKEGWTPVREPLPATAAGTLSTSSDSGPPARSLGASTDDLGPMPIEGAPPRVGTLSASFDPGPPTGGLRASTDLGDASAPAGSVAASTSLSASADGTVPPAKGAISSMYTLDGD